MIKNKVNCRSIFNQCLFCRSKSEHPAGICPDCYDDLPWLGSHCQICSLPLCSEGLNLTCAHCIKRCPSYNKAQAVFEYRFPIDHLIGQIKYARKPQYIGHLVRLMAERIVLPPDLDCLIPIPMHPFNHFFRGFNQADLIATELSLLTGIPCDNSILKKTFKTPHQMSLRRKERLKSQRNAFQCTINQYQNILLIDDVMTTGATIEEASKALKRSGIQIVNALVIARA